MPHSNFHPELHITGDGSAVKIGGPLLPSEDDGDLVSIVVSAFVTQAPSSRLSPPAAQQGATGSSSVELRQADLALEDGSWECSAETQGGQFREDWAYASAELVEVASDGAIERYTWSQWVWLRRP